MSTQTLPVLISCSDRPFIARRPAQANDFCQHVQSHCTQSDSHAHIKMQSMCNVWIKSTSNSLLITKIASEILPLYMSDTHPCILRICQSKSFLSVELPVLFQGKSSPCRGTLAMSSQVRASEHDIADLSHTSLAAATQCYLHTILTAMLTRV